MIKGRTMSKEKVLAALDSELRKLVRLYGRETSIKQAFLDGFIAGTHEQFRKDFSEAGIWRPRDSEHYWKEWCEKRWLNSEANVSTNTELFRRIRV